MDPATIAENAVNLNVNLMRWRVLPDLNVDMLASTKFLLIGAGVCVCPRVCACVCVCTSRFSHASLRPCVCMYVCVERL